MELFIKEYNVLIDVFVRIILIVVIDNLILVYINFYIWYCF